MMLSTDILRKCLSGLRRIPSQYSRPTCINGPCQYFTPSSRLMTSRQYGKFTPRISYTHSQESLVTSNYNRLSVYNSQLRLYSDSSNDQSKSEPSKDRTKSEAIIQKSKSMFQRLLQEGQIPMREPQSVTSLPEKIKFTGKETYITCEIVVTGTFPDIELFLISASSGTDNFLQVCKPDEELYSYKVALTGFDYDMEADLVLRDGEPVETTEPKQALQNFIDFIEKHDNPILIFYHQYSKIDKISTLTNKWGLFDEMISAVPYCVDASRLARKVIRKEDVGNYKLATLCQKFFGQELQMGDQLTRVDAIHRLFSEHLQQKGYADLVAHTDQYYTRNSLVQMVVDGQMHVYTMDTLARAGLGLDQLKFLKEKGFDEFMSYLKERNLLENTIKNLYSVL